MLTDFRQRAGQNQGQNPGQSADQRGLSLVEILVSMTLGVLLLLGLTTFMANTLVSDTRMMLLSKLNQEARATMTLMVRDIRRAGSWGSPDYASGPLAGVGAGPAYPNPQPFTDLNTGTAGCILYRYDKNANSLQDATEYAGFRLSGGVVQMLDGPNVATATCASGTSTGWEPLTDARNTRVTGLTFALTNSAPVYVSGTSGPNIRVRFVTITLTVQSAADADLTLTLQETVKLQNDLYSPS